MRNATEIFGAIKRSIGIKTDTELSKVLNIERSTLSTWKQRDSIDYKIIVSFCEKNNLSLDEIILGKVPAEDFEEWKNRYISCLEENKKLNSQLMDAVLKNPVSTDVSQPPKPKLNERKRSAG